MPKRYRVSLADKLKCPHILALKTLPTEKYTQTTSWPSVLSSVAKIRGARFSWASTSRSKPVGTVMDWIKVTPGLEGWVLSDQCFRSPAKWPKPVYSAFRYNLIPSPHEIANVDMNYTYARSERAFRDFLVVLLYCMGLPIDMIAKAYDTSENEIINFIRNGIEGLQMVPEYQLWATGTDFRKALLSPWIGSIPIRKRMRFVAALQSNPFYADAELAAKLVSSSPYYSYLIYGSPKRMRLTKGCRIYRTGEQNGS